MASHLVIAPSPPALLVLRGVCVGYRCGGRYELVLEGASLTVGVGEVVAVLGQRWEGKTTLLELAAGMVLPDRGEVFFGGVDFASYSRGRREELLGREIVWLDRQESSIGLGVLDHLGLPMVMRGGPGRRQVHLLAAEALERVGVAHIAGRRVDQLSRWERVLLGVAGAVIARPKLVVVDDLFDALGGPRTFQVGDLLRSLALDLGFGVLFSVSDIEATLMAHRVVAFEQRALRLLSDNTTSAGANQPRKTQGWTFGSKSGA